MRRKLTKPLPDPIYLNQKEGAALIRVEEKALREFSKQGHINRYPRQGTGFVYKIKELIRLADLIDNETLKIN